MVDPLEPLKKDLKRIAAVLTTPLFPRSAAVTRGYRAVAYDSQGKMIRTQSFGSRPTLEAIRLWIRAENITVSLVEIVSPGYKETYYNGQL